LLGRALLPRKGLINKRESGKPDQRDIEVVEKGSRFSSFEGIPDAQWGNHFVDLRSPGLKKFILSRKGTVMKKTK